MRLRLRRVGAAVVMAVAVGLVAGGCSTITSTIDTDNALRNAGFQSVKVNPDPTSDTITVSVSVAAAPTDSDARSVASIVWQNFHTRFSYLNVTVHGIGTPPVQEQLSFDQVQQMFGARDPAWNKDTIRSGVQGVLVGLGVGVLVVIGAVVLIIVLVRRSNRRKRPPQPPWPGGPYGGGYGGGYGGYPQAGYPPGGYQPGGYPQPGYPGQGPAYPPPAYPPEPGYPPPAQPPSG